MYAKRRVVHLFTHATPREILSAHQQTSSLRHIRWRCFPLPTLSPLSGVCLCVLKDFLSGHRSPKRAPQQVHVAVIEGASARKQQLLHTLQMSLTTGNSRNRPPTHVRARGPVVSHPIRRRQDRGTQDVPLPPPLFPKEGGGKHFCVFLTLTCPGCLAQPTSDEDEQSVETRL